MKRQDMVDHEYRDSDGYWIELKPGFILVGEYTHGIVERTRSAARAKLALVQRCDCAACKRQLA